nr:serine hydrolase [Bacteroidota bacterium]
RLDSTISFPYQMALGAVQESLGGQENLIYDMGAEIARQCKRLGIHVNFAPVIDVNNNPNNPVINFRSFGEEKYNVTKKSIAYMKGMQENGVLATAKHFPGHGDTGVDSHYDLPLIKHDRKRLDSLELYPFRELIKEGVGSIMIAHLSIPALDDTKNLPSTLSKPIVTGLLKEELQFNGLIFTDAMNMKGVTKYFPPGIADVNAVLAGNDILEFSLDIPKAIDEIKKAIKAGKITQQEIESRCKKILAYKKWMGLHQYQAINTENLIEDLNAPKAQLLNRKLIEGALTTVKNSNNILPLKKLDTLKVATISIGADEITAFQKTIENYVPADHFFISNNSTEEMIGSLKKQLKKYNLVILGLHSMGYRPSNTIRYNARLQDFIKEVNINHKTVTTLFLNPYILDKIADISLSEGIVLTYQDNKVAQELSAQALFGAIGTAGKLPVTVNNNFSSGDGAFLLANGRFKYTIPEEVGMDDNILKNIDSLVHEAIEAKAIPGGQVLVARHGKVIFHKSYGHHSYEEQVPVKNSDLYDLASLTKVSASLPALMKLYDEGKLDLDGKLGDYLPDFKRTNKKDLTFREMLTHQAGLKAWIPFWKNTVRKNGTFKWFTFKADSSRRFPYKVTDNLYLNRNYYKKIYKEIKKSPLNASKSYVYSDLSFYLYPLIVQRITGKNFEAYLKEEIYEPIGAFSLTYNPYQHFGNDQIVPTELDTLFRKSLLHGRVHDEGAAMLNGISGHAGLFGTANDLAKLMQLYLQAGYYEGKKFIKESTIDEFTRCQYCDQGNRRALGFDRPNIKYVENGNTAIDASQQSFGHTGFTGTFAWVDPAYGLVYIFLSNRVYPTRENKKLYDLNTRTRIQQVIYDAIKDKDQANK